MKTGETGSIHAALAPPLDVPTLLGEVPELSLAEGQSQGPFHHLDTLGHTLEVVRRVEAELEERRLGARVGEEAREGLRLVGLLHDVAKPVTRTEFEGRAIFVAHDTLGARLAHGICRRLGLSARLTDLVTTITALHLKIGFMGNERSDYPPERLVRAAGPFGEELAVLCWADRLAAQGPRLKDEHIERHRELCVEFLRRYRGAEPGPETDYATLAKGLGLPSGADAGYAAGRIRLLVSRGLGEDEARVRAAALLGLDLRR
ncbi:HD domain-containing protein [Rubrobacter marinus]|uniref:HD domain-containing protein n=1 Tax=Rubrobacter marinus TaxID=2653852 RepID=A0A6G8PZD7_9ACTN|nr:HD domain-containing protein [Rubrobacter marinus]QIN79487.1 HD domain-containing protein [Rubrobacter marinus]